MKKFDHHTFWEVTKYATRSYVDVQLNDELVASVESKLGYSLPRSYIDLCRIQNGGIPRHRNHRTSEKTSWADNHVAISGIAGIGQSKEYSLLGHLGSQFMIDEWGYPPIGVYFADCPSAGHDMICLDYRMSSLIEEPQVVHVDQELDYKITFLAKNFAAFVQGLLPDSEFDQN